MHKWREFTVGKTLIDTINKERVSSERMDKYEEMFSRYFKHNGIAQPPNTETMRAEAARPVFCSKHLQDFETTNVLVSNRRNPLLSSDVKLEKIKPAVRYKPKPFKQSLKSV